MAGITYRVYFGGHGLLATSIASAPAYAVWTIRGVGPGGRGRGAGTSRYAASGPGVSPGVKVESNSISLQGTLPSALNGMSQVAVYAEVQTGTPPATVDKVPPRTVTLSGIRSAELDWSSVKPQDGPVTVAYEAFHYLALPNPRDLTCTVIKTLGDKFDFLAYYSDFRVDNQEAGTPSTGPLGGGPSGGSVTGIGASSEKGWRVTAVVVGSSGSSYSRCMPAPTRCRSGRPKAQRQGTTTTLRSTITNSESARQTGR